METPINAIAVPIKSKRSGFQPSKTMPHRIERLLKVLAYVTNGRAFPVTKLPYWLEHQHIICFQSPNG